MDAAIDRIQIIFDGPPSHESGRFVEVEAGGKSINFGEWKQVKDGYWILELPLCLADLAILTAAQPLGDKAVPVLEKWPALCSPLFRLANIAEEGSGRWGPAQDRNAVAVAEYRHGAIDFRGDIPMIPLTYADGELSKRILEFLKREHSGREHAIPHKAIREHFCVRDDGQDNHPFRRLYENKVCSCADGIFYPTTWREVYAWGEWIERTYHSAALKKSKVDALLLARPDLRPPVTAVQGNLFEGVGA